MNFAPRWGCLLYTSDAADDMQCVDLGGRRIIKKKKNFFQAEDGIRDVERSRVLGDVYKRQIPNLVQGLRPCLVHISSNFVFCTKGGIYVSKTFLVFRSVGGARQTNYNIITRKWNLLERRRGDLPLFLRP